MAAQAGVGIVFNQVNGHEARAVPRSREHSWLAARPALPSRLEPTSLAARGVSIERSKPRVCVAVPVRSTDTIDPPRSG